MSMDTSLYAVAYLDASYQNQAQIIAEQLGCALIVLNALQDYYWVIVVDENGVSLLQPQEQFKPVRVDFVEGAARHRRLFGGGRGQMIAKAVGLADQTNLTILDATAGLGRDAFVLASLGGQVTMLERSALVSALLEDGLTRAKTHISTAIIAQRMNLIHISAHQWLINAQDVDVVYLDPMFPETNKSALVKKEMRLFHELIGRDEDADALLALALNVARYRVVVKRPRLAAPLAHQPPTYTLTGKTNRFDVYVVKSLKVN